MNGKLIITGLLTIATLTATAGSGLVQLGLKAGITTQSVNIIRPDAGIHSLASDARAGFQIGVISRINLALFHIQPELLYTMNSYKLIAAPSGITGGAEPSLSTSKIRTSTVELPVMVGLRLLFLRINAGPVFNLLTDTSVKSDKTPHTVDIVRPSISFAVGIGADIGKINVDLRYNGNFKRPEQFIRIADQQSLPYKTKFRSWALSVGYLF